MEEKRKFIANLNNLELMIGWIQERITKYFTQSELNKIEELLEEILINIIEKNHPNQTGQIEISLYVNDFLEIKIKEKAKAYNPIAKKVGGKHTSIFNTEYIRKESCNILTLKRKHKINY